MCDFHEKWPVLAKNRRFHVKIDISTNWSIISCKMRFQNKSKNKPNQSSSIMVSKRRMETSCERWKMTNNIQHVRKTFICLSNDEVELFRYKNHFFCYSLTNETVFDETCMFLMKWMIFCWNLHSDNWVDQFVEMPIFTWNRRFFARTGHFSWKSHIFRRNSHFLVKWQFYHKTGD